MDEEEEEEECRGNGTTKTIEIASEGFRRWMEIVAEPGNQELLAKPGMVPNGSEDVCKFQILRRDLQKAKTALDIQNPRLNPPASQNIWVKLVSPEQFFMFLVPVT